MKLLFKTLVREIARVARRDVGDGILTREKERRLKKFLACQ